MIFSRYKSALTSIAATVIIAGCNGPLDAADGVESAHGALVTDPNNPYDPYGAIATTLAPVRNLKTPGKIYLRSFAETFAGTGSFLHTVHVYQPDANGEAISFELSATDAGGAVDANHRLSAMRTGRRPSTG